MPVVKGGVWTNIEDEILKAAVSKYGLNQWARVSSLLARKTPKQCKARWAEWLDPGIRKIEWSKEEDEKLLHLAKLMPTQWRTIAPIVGRTATQCLERYQKLLDEAEARENDELALGGPEGGETAAPSADDVRRLRPGELDPDPESKPARPDTIDLDEDEKEMLSEARARLANTQGKKAKRKARERQLEESRRLANLQKRRELKTAGINIKITTRKPGQMDYNADIPFEKAPAPGFYDTQQEDTKNEREREMFDPRRQQLANKRKGDQQEDEGEDRKRRKSDKNQSSGSSQAAQKAGQMQKVREAERSTKRRALNLPAPQVGESEIEDIVKMGMAGQRASQYANASENEATRGFVGEYSSMVGKTPIRTPRAAPEEDRIANEVRNARARTETQSALLGGENADLEDDDTTTGYGGAAPSKQSLATPNPLATPLRQNGTPNGAPSATPSRTPRDVFRLNDQTPSQALTGQTPREIKLARANAQNNLRAKLSALPAPKQVDFELELPEEQDETSLKQEQLSEEDAAIRDARNAAIRAAAERQFFKRQTQSYQKALPRPMNVDLEGLLAAAKGMPDPYLQAVATETALLVAHDARSFGDGATKVNGPVKSLQQFSDEELQHARMEIALELDNSGLLKGRESGAFDEAWEDLHENETSIPGLADYDSDNDSVEANQARLSAAFDTVLSGITATAESSGAVEKKLALHLGGYQARSRTLRSKMAEAHEALEKARNELEVARSASVMEDVAVRTKLEGLRDEVDAVSKRERWAQSEWKEWNDKLQEFGQ